MKAVTWRRFLAGFTILIPLVMLLAALQSGKIGNYVVTSDSMEPTLAIGDRVFTTRNYDYEPTRGDIIAVENPLKPGELLAKRVIGLPGDEVELRSGELYINGLPFSEDYVDPSNSLMRWGKAYNLVPAGHIFVLGDNRNNSYDSREFGPVPITLIKSRLTRIYWPMARATRLSNPVSSDATIPPE